MKIFSKKDKIVVVTLAALLLVSTASTIFAGIQMNKPPVSVTPPPKDDGVVTLDEIGETETDYENVDFSDKIENGVLTLAACGAEANALYDYGPLIRSAIRTAIQNPGTVLEFQEGTYYAAPANSEVSHTFDFSDDEVQGLHIKGNGCQLVLMDNCIGCFNFGRVNTSKHRPQFLIFTTRTREYDFSDAMISQSGIIAVINPTNTFRITIVIRFIVYHYKERLLLCRTFRNIIISSCASNRILTFC